MPDQPTPTQVQHPWRATLRTVFAAVVGLLSILPWILTETNLNDTVIGAQILVVTGAITRVLANAAVQEWLLRYLPFLSATSGSDPK